jgi:hypothetical protein
MTKANYYSKHPHHHLGMTVSSWTLLPLHQDLLPPMNLLEVLKFPSFDQVPSLMLCRHVLPARLVLIDHFGHTSARLASFQAACQLTTRILWRPDERVETSETHFRPPTQKLMSHTLKLKLRKLRLCVASTLTLAANSSWTKQVRDPQE